MTYTAKLEALRELRSEAAKLAGHSGVARGYEYHQALVLLIRKYEETRVELRARLSTKEVLDAARDEVLACDFAPELPRKVEPGTTLTVGARYRITAISTDDSCPANQVGDVVIGFPKDSGMPVGAVFVNWDGAGYWFAKGDGPSGGTYVTGLELVDEPGEGE